MILVVGATGLVGRQICRLLAASGKPTRAMVRATSDQAKVDELRSLGADVVQGDLRDPGSIQAACQGVSAIIATASSMPFAYRPGENTPETTDEGGYLCLIDAACEAGVQQFIYTSFPTMTPRFPAAGRQASRRGSPARVRAGLHHPAAHFLHGGLAQPGGWIRLRQPQGDDLRERRKPDQLDLVPGCGAVRRRLPGQPGGQECHPGTGRP